MIGTIDRSLDFTTIMLGVMAIVLACTLLVSRQYLSQMKSVKDWTIGSSLTLLGAIGIVYARSTADPIFFLIACWCFVNCYHFLLKGTSIAIRAPYFTQYSFYIRYLSLIFFIATVNISNFATVYYGTITCFAISLLSGAYILQYRKILFKHGSKSYPILASISLISIIGIIRAIAFAYTEFEDTAALNTIAQLYFAFAIVSLGLFAIGAIAFIISDDIKKT